MDYREGRREGRKEGGREGGRGKMRSYSFTLATKTAKKKSRIGKQRKADGKRGRP